MQCAHGVPPLCFGDRIRRFRDKQILDPLRCVSWPVLNVGDMVLVTPVDGDYCLMNRQPTLVQESMLGMRIRVGPNLSFGATCGPIEALRGDFDGDEINLHLPQGLHVASELSHLLSVPEQIVTGQSGSPVVRPIQDAIAAAHWLTQLDPRTHCPAELPRQTFEQIAADIDVDLHFRLAGIRSAWDRMRRERPDHPLVRAAAAAGVDYMRTGYCLFSLCLPAECFFRGREPATARLVTMYRLARRLPPWVVAVDVHRGLFLGGILTSDTLGGSRGLLNHVYQMHGPAEGTRFLSRIQRLTTSVSLYGYCPSVGLDDCFLPVSITAAARAIFADRVERFRNGGNATDAAFMDAPYRVDGGNQADAEVGRLVDQLAESEAAVTRFTLGCRIDARAGSDHWTPTSSARLNQIALFCMLGTKGSVSNLMQCTHALGQQIIQSSRLPLGDYDRVFPHDPKHAPESETLESRGLLWNESFVEGLSPLSFFVHAIAGREALVDVSTDTALSGYSMRLGVKLLESCTTEYRGRRPRSDGWGGGEGVGGGRDRRAPSVPHDHTVRDNGRIIQFQYNGTGLNPNPPGGRSHHTDRPTGGSSFRPPPVAAERSPISRRSFRTGTSSSFKTRRRSYKDKGNGDGDPNLRRSLLAPPGSNRLHGLHGWQPPHRQYFRPPPIDRGATNSTTALHLRIPPGPPKLQQALAGNRPAHRTVIPGGKLSRLPRDRESGVDRRHRLTVRSPHAPRVRLRTPDPSRIGCRRDDALSFVSLHTGSLRSGGNGVGRVPLPVARHCPALRRRPRPRGRRRYDRNVPTRLRLGGAIGAHVCGGAGVRWVRLQYRPPLHRTGHFSSPRTRQGHRRATPTLPVCLPRRRTGLHCGCRGVPRAGTRRDVPRHGRGVFRVTTNPLYPPRFMFFFCCIRPNGTKATE